MRFKNVLLLVLAVLMVASLPAISATAKSSPSGSKLTANQSADQCTDAKLLEAIGKDLTDLGDSMKKVPSTGAGGVYSIMIDIANMRIKYEDMDLPKDQPCIYLLTETIVLFANISDWGLVEMGEKLGLDKDMIAKNRQFVSDRLNKQIKKVTDLAGVKPATPPAS